MTNRRVDSGMANNDKPKKIVTMKEHTTDYRYYNGSIVGGITLSFTMAQVNLARKS